MVLLKLVKEIVDLCHTIIPHTEALLDIHLLKAFSKSIDLIDLMNSFLAQYPSLKIFSLPKTSARRTIELGLKGESALVKTAMNDLTSGVSALGFSWDEHNT